MAINRDELLYDIQDGREKLRFGNPVLCKEWVCKVVDKYGDGVENITEYLVGYGSEGGEWAHALEDASMLIAKLERHLG